MNALNLFRKIPGAIMVFPLLVGALINSFFPQVLEIGGFTTGLAGGATPLIGAFLFCMGAGIHLKAAPEVLKKGASVTLSKFAVGAGLGIVLGMFFGNQGILGLSSLAIISAMTNTNGGLYAALAGEFGDETDVGAIAVISMNDGPFLTMIALGAAGLASFPFLALVGVLLPMVAGMIIGNIDEKARTFLVNGGMVLIPVFAFSLGCNMEIGMLFSAGLTGIFLGLAVVFIGGFFNIFADRLSGGSGICGAAASSTAGNAIATPAAVALMDPSLQPLVNAATSQVAAAVITSAVFTPVLVVFVSRKFIGKRTLR